MKAIDKDELLGQQKIRFVVLSLSLKRDRPEKRIDELNVGSSENERGGNGCFGGDTAWSESLGVSPDV